MLDLLQKNTEMLSNHNYKLADERQMLKIQSLSNPNDYDYYLVACCLCNYPIEEKAEARILRQKYFELTKGSINGFEHQDSDYDNTVKTNVTCKNTGNINKYGLYEFEINVNDRNLISTLWDAKQKNCLKYVDSKTYPDKLIISVSKDQVDNFIGLLNTLMIQFTEDDIKSNMVFKNKSVNSLIDTSKLNLPFTPYPFQLEDAAKIVSKKRFLLGHEMGCISGDSNVIVIIDDIIKTITLKELFDLYKIDSTIKIKSLVDDTIFKFMPIKAVLDKGKKSIIKITTQHSTIKCTLDHEILTTQGYIEAQKLQLNDLVISTNNIDNITHTEKIININKLSNEENVYDVVIDSYNVHNFVTNNIVVHNCGKTFISILVGESLNKYNNIQYSTLDNLNYDDIVITDKGPLPIGKIVEEDIDCKVQVCKNGITSFVNILNKKSIEV